MAELQFNNICSACSYTRIEKHFVTDVQSWRICILLEFDITLYEVHQGGVTKAKNFTCHFLKYTHNN